VEARVRLFDALCHFLFARQEAFGPILLCLDDLHWFDQTSLSWLMHLCHQLLSKNSQIMVVSTYRSEDQQSLQELHQNLARLGLSDELKLEGLDAGSILELFQYVFGPGSGGQSIVMRLKEATGGNPFFIQETLQALREEGKFPGYPDDLAVIPLPDSIRAAVERRIGRLNAKSRQILEAGAVLSSAFRFKTLQMTAGRSELETSLSLDQLTARQLLTEEVDHYRFHHDLVRRATLAAINPVRLQILHARAGRALEKYEPDAVTVLAYHYDAGGEWQKALHYYEFSARNAETLFAWREAIAQYDRMLALLDRLDPTYVTPEYFKQRGTIFAKLILLHHNQGNLTARNERLEQFDALVSICKDPSLELNYLLLRNRYLHLDGKYTEAIQTAERGLALSDKLQDMNAQCRLLAQIGLISFFLGLPDQALAKLEAARALADQNQDLELRANVLGRLAFVKCLFGKYREALECHKEAYGCYQRLGNHYFATQHLTEIGDICASLGLFAESSQSLTEILDLARKTNLRYDEGHSLLAMGSLHACQGEYETAVQVYREALDIFYTMQSHHLTATAETALGAALYQLGDYDKSLDCLGRGLERSRSIKFPIRVALALILMARVELAKGNFDLAKTHLAEGLAIARPTQSVELIIAGLAVAADLGRRNGNLPEALANIEEALQLTSKLTCRCLSCGRALWQALFCSSKDQPEAALAHTTRAIQLIPRATQDWIQHEQVLLTHARVLRLSGELDCRARAGAERPDHPPGQSSPSWILHCARSSTRRLKMSW
jgi:tetratricopeptide (TPR) repeat protein